MLFETERLYVRQLKQGDLDALHVLYSDPGMKEHIQPLLTIDETKKIFDQQLEQYISEPLLGRHIIVDKNDDTFVGLLMLRTDAGRQGVEIGYSLRKQDWGRGYATEIVKGGVDYVFEVTPFTTIYAITHLKNTGSKNVLDKCGFSWKGDIDEDGEPSSLFAIEKNSVSR